ncbi:YcaO-like family protein [Desulfoluna spongiiphila]|uniref:YcaO-like family protein n=1 Tax=Desulfoluna spongiiphila TaxID=419481 RepID=UPI00125B0475|nr:YcaO-like family protein [Desulfoluna spongiiphila]VVS93768.1 ycao-like domain [Desulfoluna spongiiphila]
MKHETMTLPLGKDAGFTESIDAMRAKLLDLGIGVEERSWLHPVDGAWSVNLRLADCPNLYTNGKGGSEGAALASAYGELFERLSTGYLLSDLYLPEPPLNGGFFHGPGEVWLAPEMDTLRQEALSPLLWDHYDPDGELEARHLMDFNTGGARGVCCLPFDQEGGAPVLFPVAVLENLYVSNGMSAGNTLLEAKVQALSEVAERHVKARIIAEGIALPEIPLGVLDRYPVVKRALAELEDRGLVIYARDASLGGRWPVVCIAAVNPEDGGVFAAFGAHPLFGVALERTFTEMLQGRSEFKGFPAPSFDTELVASPTNIEEHFVDSAGVLHWDFFKETPDFPFTPWGLEEEAGGGRGREYDLLVARIHEEGFQIYSWVTTHLGMPCCRMVVPGMSEIYPVEDLLWENRSVQAEVRHGLLALAQSTPEEAEDLADLLEEGGWGPEALVCELVGVEVPPGSAWADARVAEMIALCRLRGGDREGAARWSAMASQMELPSVRRLFFRCLEARLEADSRAMALPELGRIFGAEADRLTALACDGTAPFPFFDEPLNSFLDKGPHGHITRCVRALRQSILP